MKRKRIIFLVLAITISVYCYEKRTFHTSSNGVSITIWQGKFGTGVYYLYPYKCFDIFRGKGEYIKVDSRNQFFQLRFIDDKTLAICIHKKEYIDVKFTNYKMEKIYNGYEERLKFDNQFPREKCKAYYSWAKIWETPSYCK